MTVGFAAAAVNGWLDGTFATASCFVKLHTADPGAAGATAAAAGDTTRKQATMAAAAKDPSIIAYLTNPFSLAGGFTGPAQPPADKPEHDPDLGLGPQGPGAQTPRARSVANCCWKAAKRPASSASRTSCIRFR